MNANPFSTTGPSGIAIYAEPLDKSSADTTWCVLDAANDLGDLETVNACRRVIDANLGGRPAMQSDLKIIVEYFR
jgi:hypothetical protein